MTDEESYLILKVAPESAERRRWVECGEVEAAYPRGAAEKAAEQNGIGDYLIFKAKGYGIDRFTVTARTEYDVETTAVEALP